MSVHGKREKVLHLKGLGVFRILTESQEARGSFRPAWVEHSIKQALLFVYILKVLIASYYSWSTASSATLFSNWL